LSELNDDEIRALAKSVDLDIPDSDITDVNYSLNAMLQAIDDITSEGISAIEPLPIIIQKED
tara:strand:+ start:1253 stop:1438 length:186 start_codon:yes stop_codon:yes gene_type:complete